MTVLQAFFDESGKQSDHPLIAVCCVCGTSAQMNKFDDYWRALLEKHSVSDLHMKRASDYKRSWGTLPKQTVEERIEGLKPFADCMGENLQFGLIEAWDVKGFKAIPAQARNKIGNPQDPYYLAFARALLDLPDHAGEDDVLSLICDHDEESAWDSYLAQHPVTVAEAIEDGIAKAFSEWLYVHSERLIEAIAARAASSAKEQPIVGFPGLAGPDPAPEGPTP